MNATHPQRYAILHYGQQVSQSDRLSDAQNYVKQDGRKLSIFDRAARMDVTNLSGIRRS